MAGRPLLAWDWAKPAAKAGPSSGSSNSRNAQIACGWFKDKLVMKCVRDRAKLAKAGAGRCREAGTLTLVMRPRRQFPLASQRIIIAKLGGLSGDIALQRLSAWSSARNAVNPNEWSPEQWPDQVRQEADEFAERLREHGFALPVCYFAEWADLWSMGDLFSRWLTPPNCPGPVSVYANRFEVFAYGLPDDGCLANCLAAAGAQQSPETDWFIARLREAVSAWELLVPSATLVVIRSVVGRSASDEEVVVSLKTCAPWFS